MLEQEKRELKRTIPRRPAETHHVVVEEAGVIRVVMGAAPSRLHSVYSPDHLELALQWQMLLASPAAHAHACICMCLAQLGAPWAHAHVHMRTIRRARTQFMSISRHSAPQLMILSQLFVDQSSTVDSAMTQQDSLLNMDQITRYVVDTCHRSYETALQNFGVLLKLTLARSVRDCCRLLCVTHIVSCANASAAGRHPALDACSVHPNVEESEGLDGR